MTKRKNLELGGRVGRPGRGRSWENGGGASWKRKKLGDGGGASRKRRHWVGLVEGRETVAASSR